MNTDHPFQVHKRFKDSTEKNFLSLLVIATLCIAISVFYFFFNFRHHDFYITVIIL